MHRNLRNAGLVLLVSLVVLEVPPTCAMRTDVSQRPAPDLEHPVHILITRHGLSCANIVNSFAKSKAHALMKDPLLCAVGSKMTREAGVQTAAWLEKHDMKVDAVISSVLARAIETAALQYPSFRPIWAVPYIREAGVGMDNEARASSEQLGLLNTDLTLVNTNQSESSPFEVNFHWSETFDRNSKGDWVKFRTFLQQSFLPALVARLEKPRGSPIVLAVVTHSNFMMEGEVNEKCSKLFATSGKPLNNQVLHIPYKLSTNQQVDGSDVTTRYSLLDEKLVDQNQQCELVTEGTALPTYQDGKLKKLCRRDIGDACMKQIMRHDNMLMKAKPTLIEDDIEKKLQQVAKWKKIAHSSKDNDARTWAEARAQTAVRTRELQLLKETTCWFGGTPEVPGEEPEAPSSRSSSKHGYMW